MSNFSPPDSLDSYVTAASSQGVVLGYGHSFTPGTASSGIRSKTVLLLHGLGHDGETTFYESSYLNHVVTVFGNARISNTQFKFGDSSMYFDGSSYISIPDSAHVQLTGQFTIEAWVYPTANSVGVFGTRTYGSHAGYQWALGGANAAWHGATGLNFYYGNQGWNHYVRDTQTLLANNVWQHIAVTRDATNTWRIFKDGISLSMVKLEFDGPFNDAVSLNNSFPILIGLGFTGYIADLRILEDYAEYTANFTPPGFLPGYIDPDQTQTVSYATSFRPGYAYALANLWTGFKYGDATNWSFSCNDAATSQWAIEDKGSAFFPSGAMYLTYGATPSEYAAAFGSTSMFFPTSSRVVLPAGSGAIAAYSDFTFEFWVNIPGGGGFPYYIPGLPAFTVAMTASVWYHLAISRKSNILRYFVNGAKIYEALSLSAFDLVGFGTMNGNSTNVPFYMDSIGFSSTLGYYTSDFTRSTIPFYNVPSSVGARMTQNYSLLTGEAIGSTITPTEADSQWNKTVLLIPGAGPLNSKNITDSKGRRLFNQADVVYSDAHSRNGLTSLYFNGSSAKLTIEPSRNLDLIDGDFTIEMWIYPTRFSASLVDRWGDTTACFALYLNADGVIRFNFRDAATGTTTTIDGPVPVIANMWSFISVCHYGTDYRVSVNGTGGTTGTTAKTPWREASRMFQGGGYAGDMRSWDTCLIIGANAEDGAYPGSYYQGYMEDVRITNGFARYSNLALYSTPVAAFLPSGSGAAGDPYWADVVLLAHFDEPEGTIYNVREAKGHVLALSGPGYVTSSGQYGGSYFRASYGTVSVPYGAEFDLSAGDFTIEAWVSDLSGGEWCGNTHGTDSSGWQVSYSGIANPATTRSQGVIQWTQWNSSGVQDIAVSPLYLFYGERSRWHHLAVVRKGDVITLYVDGVGAATTITRRPRISTNPVYLVGYGNSTSTSAFNRVEEFRITRTARYPVDFKVPVAKFPEVAFSYGAATAACFYTFVPAQVRLAATVVGPIAESGYTVIQPSIIGKPSVEGPTFSQFVASVLAADAKGGEGIVSNVGFADTVITRQTLNQQQVYYVNDEAIAQAVRGIASALSMNDLASAMLASVGILESVVFTSSTPPISLVAAPVTESVELGSSMSASHGAYIAVSIAIADAAERAWHENVAELLSLSMPVGLVSMLTSTGDNLALAASISHAAHRVATDGLGLKTSASSRASLGVLAAEDIRLSGTPGTTLTLYITVAEDVALADLPVQQWLYQAVMQESVQFSSFFASPAFTAWAMNLRNASVTQYSNFQYNSFAKMGDRYLGASDQGLFWMDGDTDATRPLNSRITTGILQPNGNKLAGVLYAYLGMRGNGQFAVTVTDEAGGSYNYTLNATNMETSRVVFGRGLRTRYFTFSLESTGQDFDLDSVEFVTSDMSRKLQR